MLTPFMFLFDCLLLVTSRCLSTWQACVCLHQWTIGLLNCRHLGLHFSGNETKVYWIHRATPSYLQCLVSIRYPWSLLLPLRPISAILLIWQARCCSHRLPSIQGCTVLADCHTSSAEFRTACHVPRRANARNAATIDGKQNRRWRGWER